MLSAHARPAMRTAAALAGLLAAALATPRSATAQSELDSYIQGQMTASHVPGLAACLINGDHVIWAKGYGWANIEEQRPVTPDTLFKQGSVAKTLTATALMQLCERGLLALDDDINAYLSFPVHNPNVPAAPITFRQLLTHTSSIRDNWSVMYALLTFGDPRVPLAEFMQQYFTPGGRYYNPTENFSATSPGQASGRQRHSPDCWARWRRHSRRQRNPRSMPTSGGR